MKKGLQRMSGLEQLREFRKIMVRKLEGELTTERIYEYLHIIKNVNDLINNYACHGCKYLEVKDL